MSRQRRRGAAGARGRPPEGEPWVWLTRQLLQSAAWSALTLNARRFVEFLLIEHMSHAGTENGNLIATYKQLEQFGINAKLIRDAIALAVEVGLVDRRASSQARNGRRNVPAAYTLTWFGVGDAAPTDRWKFYRGKPLRRLDPAPIRGIFPPPVTGGEPPPVTGGRNGAAAPRNGGCAPPPVTGGASNISGGCDTRAALLAARAVRCRDASEVTLALRVGIAWLGATQRAIAADLGSGGE